MRLTTPASRVQKTTPYPWLEAKKNPRAHEQLLRFVQKLIEKKGWKGDGPHTAEEFIRWRNRY